MSFIKSLWAFAKSHPIGALVTFVVVLPLVFGGIALMVYRAVRSGVAKVAPAAAAVMPVK